MCFESHFLAEDQEKALKELVCIADCLQLSINYIFKGDYEKANLHLENASRSVKALERLKENKADREGQNEDLLAELNDLGVDIHYLKLG